MSTLPAGDARQRTFDRQRALERAGYKVRTMWECELKQQLQRDPEMKQFFDTVPVLEPMNPRDGFYGGRTNCRQMYYKCKEGERIQYIDICSLYPYVCKNGTFPVGHPKVITENFGPTGQYRGIVKARVLCPANLLFPVLPYRSGGKLLFPCCRTCAETRSGTNCQHSVAERALTGVWATCELDKAVELGYEVLELIEVYHYDQWSTYDSRDPSTGMFTGYINAFLKSKQQASGYPSWVKTDADKDEYIRRFAEREKIQLDKDSIEKNSGLRSLSKLMLNSFWGWSFSVFRLQL